MFTDLDFPASAVSLGGKWGRSNTIEWKRLSEIMPKMTFVGGKIEPGDILQG